MTGSWHWLRCAAMAAVASAGLVTVATGCSSSGGSSASSSASTAVAVSPSASTSAGMSGTTTTLHLYGVQESSHLYTPQGRSVDNPSTAPALGSYVVGTDTDYEGGHAAHSAASVGSDHLYCLITSAPATGTCSAEFQLGDGMLISDHSTQELDGNGAMTFPLTGGTGSYAGVHGTVTVTPVPNTNNSDFTVTYSH